MSVGKTDTGKSFLWYIIVADQSAQLVATIKVASGEGQESPVPVADPLGPRSRLHWDWPAEVPLVTDPIFFYLNRVAINRSPQVPLSFTSLDPDII